ISLHVSEPVVLFATLACLLIGLASGEDLEAVATKSTEKVDAAVATTKLTPSPSEDSKSKTEKRDSSDQTGGIFIGPTPKDSPFRPLYPSSGYFEAATAETRTPIFGPTTIRYTAAEAAPQTYYDRPDNGHSALRFVGPKYAQQGAPPSAPSPTHRFSFAVPPQVALYQRPTAIKSSSAPPHPHPLQHTHAPPHPPQIFNYGDVEQAEPATASGATYERAGPQLSHKQQQQQQSPKYQQQQRIQYIIAIPLSYMRQMQQQQQQLFLAPPTATASTTTTTTSSAAPPPSPSAPAVRHPAVQLLGPLGRPYYQSDAASAPAPPAGPPHQQYLQIPTSILLAAAQQLQQHHQQQHLQAIYAKPQPPAAAYQPTQLIFQPLASQVQHPQHQQQPQLQLQRIFLQQPQTQSPTIYAEQPATSSLYAYPLQQQQQRLKQPQQHKYSSATPTAPTTSTTSSTTATVAATSAATGVATATGAATTAEGVASASATAARHHHLPLVHYNPIYVQAPAAIEQQKQQQHQFAILPRFGNNNPGREPVAPLHVVALSPSNPGPPIHHYHHYQALPLYHHHHPLAHGRNPPAYVSDEEGPSKSTGSSQYLAGPTPAPPAVSAPGPVPMPVSVPLAVHGSGMTAASPAIIPYFSHPGAVHYGTHLYHPGAGTGLTSAGGAGVATASVAAATQASSNSKQQQQSQTATSAGHLPGGSNNIVKYP
ncbi:uncharacterized protein Dana_GF20233, partial [Drosophila ananassae]